MKTLVRKVVVAVAMIVTVAASASETPEWNNKGIVKTFHKGDTVRIKAQSESAKYVTVGTVEAICNADYIKVNGYFVAIANVEVITEYFTTKH